MSWYDTPLTQRVYEWVARDPDIIALVNDRIVMGSLPSDATFPFITYRLMDNQRSELVTHAQDDTERAYYQFNAWAKTDVVAMQVAKALIARLAVFPGCAGEADGPRTAPDPDMMLNRYIVDFSVWHTNV